MPHHHEVHPAPARPLFPLIGLQGAVGSLGGFINFFVIDTQDLHAIRGQLLRLGRDRCRIGRRRRALLHPRMQYAIGKAWFWKSGTSAGQAA